MNEEMLILKMVVDCMAGNKEKMWAIYEEYIKERHLRVSIEELIKWKERAGNGGVNSVPMVRGMAKSGIA